MSDAKKKKVVKINNRTTSCETDKFKFSEMVSMYGKRKILLKMISNGFLVKTNLDNHYHVVEGRCGGRGEVTWGDETDGAEPCV